eukprot:TRINITY_DN371_c0_g1_i1.p1 TRINITY_DN371_c0_g1~~TRINITY_DN371_c0_g1_i1.p1  ORF type:complete len:565 (-),score=87.88 TRINITY_DN371_c0_g1_i1:695-2389(-)
MASTAPSLSRDSSRNRQLPRIRSEELEVFERDLSPSASSRLALRGSSELLDDLLRDSIDEKPECLLPTIEVPGTPRRAAAPDPMKTINVPPPPPATSAPSANAVLSRTTRSLSDGSTPKRPTLHEMEVIRTATASDGVRGMAMSGSEKITGSSCQTLVRRLSTSSGRHLSADGDRLPDIRRASITEDIAPTVTRTLTATLSDRDLSNVERKLNDSAYYNLALAPMAVDIADLSKASVAMSAVPKRPFHSHDDFEKYYDVTEVLGRGSFSVVKKVRHKETGEEYAVKMIDKKSVGAKKMMVQTEIDILRLAHHPNVLYIKEMFEDSKHINLVMELVTGGEVFDTVGEFGVYSESLASKVIYQVLLALEYLHSLGVVHRDLKPENLLYSDTSTKAIVKVADFGLSKLLDTDQLLLTACGTPDYVAPEVLTLSGYNQAVDMWSVGVILYTMLCGYHPFISDNMAELFGIIKRGRFTFPDEDWADVSESAKELIGKLLELNPKKRLSATEALKHPWVAKGAASSRPMPKVPPALKASAAKRLKAAAQATIAINRIERSASQTRKQAMV